MGRTKTVTVTRQEGEESENARDTPASNSPLFEGEDDGSITRVEVARQDPDEGYLGVLGADATEADILAKWGGSVYVCKAKGASGTILRRRTIRIAGEPNFASEAFEVEYRRKMRLPPKRRDETGGQAESLTVEKLLMLMDERDQKHKQEMESREEKTRREQDERDEKRRKDEEEREERRRNREREDEERRARLHKEDMERIRIDGTMAAQQQQVFFTNLLQMQSRESASRPDSMMALLEGVKLALAIKGDGNGDSGAPQDAVTALISRLPETLSGIASVGRGVMAEIKGAKALKGVDPKLLKLLKNPSVRQNVTRLIGNLESRGQDPAAAIAELAAFSDAPALTQVPQTPPQASSNEPEPVKRTVSRKGRPK